MPDRVTVIVDEDQGVGIDELADRLRSAGMQVEQVLGEIGMITGSVPREHREGVRTTPGVAGVEDETTFHAPPPDDDTR
ncbi:hypothetical protein GCM10027174_33610 [Salinifilum aidingensis]